MASARGYCPTPSPRDLGYRLSPLGLQYYVGDIRKSRPGCTSVPWGKGEVPGDDWLSPKGGRSQREVLHQGQKCLLPKSQNRGTRL